MATKAPSKAPKRVAKTPVEKKPVEKTVKPAPPPLPRKKEETNKAHPVWTDEYLTRVLDGKEEMPEGHIRTVALALLRRMDAEGRYNPDGLISMFRAENVVKLDSTIREAVEWAVDQVRKDNGLA